jgi:hypothetical protein
LNAPSTNPAPSPAASATTALSTLAATCATIMPSKPYMLPIERSMFAVTSRIIVPTPAIATAAMFTPTAVALPVVKKVSWRKLKKITSRIATRAKPRRLVFGPGAAVGGDDLLRIAAGSAVVNMSSSPDVVGSWSRVSIPRRPDGSRRRATGRREPREAGSRRPVRGSAAHRLSRTWESTRPR